MTFASSIFKMFAVDVSRIDRNRYIIYRQVKRAESVPIVIQYHWQCVYCMNDILLNCREGGGEVQTFAIETTNTKYFRCMQYDLEIFSVCACVF